MSTPSDDRSSLPTPAGVLAFEEYHVRLAGREWTILHTGALLTCADEARFLSDQKDRVPYGVVLWPSTIALAHDLIGRADDVRGKRVLELGAGTGLPGIIAASLDGHVVQTDRHALAMAVCKRNGERNAVGTIEYRIADWTNWDDDRQYDWIVGSDILYAERLHPYLRRIFESNLAPGGRVLLADPFRAVSLRLLEQLQANGWSITLSKWSVGDEATPSAIGVFELVPPT